MVMCVCAYEHWYEKIDCMKMVMSNLLATYTLVCVVHQ